MAKKQTTGRKPGGAAGIATIEDVAELNQATTDVEQSSIETATQEREPARATKAKSAKAKADQTADGSVSLSEIRKAAAFVNSVGGLDKAIGLLQILKVAKEVQ